MTTKSISLTLALALAFAGTAMAVPAKRGVTRTITMSDGTEVQATLEGDENAHFFRTDDGRCLQLKGDTYEYVSQDSLLQLRTSRLESKNAMRRAKAQKRLSTAYTGSKRGLVILVNFADLSFSTSRTEWDNYFNQEGYSTQGMAGSVRDYFYEQSYGKLSLSFDVVGPVTVSHKYSYYGSGDEDYVPAMIKEACQLADSEVDFSDYDWDGDGWVDQVYVVYAGYSEAQGASSQTIWPHEWALSGMGISLRLDGVSIDTYACSSELYGSGATGSVVVDGIGTACHEFSHCLGLPDFYDTSSSGTNYGMDVWSVLDYGSYNNDGYSPAAFTAYERQFCGWLQYTELKEARQVTDMPSLTDEPVAYVVYNDADPDEYYVLQNIQLKGFNAGAYGHGLLIQHVDYDETAWLENTINNTSSHQRMTIFPADNRYGAYGSNASGDPFPGTSLNTAFTNSSSPASTLYNANASGSLLMGKPIENIDETAGLISFNFNGWTTDVGVPEALEAEDISEETASFTARWTAVDGALSYDVCLEESTTDDDSPASHVVIAEGFDGCLSSTDDDISSSLDTFLSQSGWTGQNLYCSSYGLRIGNDTETGYVQTPALSVTSGSDVTILVGVQSGLAELGIVTLSGASDYQTLNQGSGYYLLYLEQYTLGSFYLRLNSFTTTYLVGLYAFEGYYTSDELSAYLTTTRSSSSASPSLSSCHTLGRLCVTSSGSTASSPDIYSTSATSYSFTHLQPAVYSYKVRAVTAQGTGSWSNSITVDLCGANAIAPTNSPLPSADTAYDLSGRQVASPLARTIYIRRGKKYLAR
ncbi:MAG: M6 family metalloprotease domain-containing protein [Prevotellaceae bacterium]|nr:M6 family metalloprotease domain-containing protein [Prevotellaceae bacterium]